MGSNIEALELKRGRPPHPMEHSRGRRRNDSPCQHLLPMRPGSSTIGSPTTIDILRLREVRVLDRRPSRQRAFLRMRSLGFVLETGTFSRIQQRYLAIAAPLRADDATKPRPVPVRPAMLRPGSARRVVRGSVVTWCFSLPSSDCVVSGVACQGPPSSRHYRGQCHREFPRRAARHHRCPESMARRMLRTVGTCVSRCS